MKRILAMILALVLCLSLTACGGDSADTASNATVLKVAISQSLTTPKAEALLKLSDELSAATDGRYKLELYPDGQLGSPSQTLKQAAAGTLDITLVPGIAVESYVPDFAIVNAPYVFDSSEHQQKVLASDALSELYGTTGEHGFTVLCGYPNHTRNLYAAFAPAAPADLQGRIIGVSKQPAHLDMAKAWGAVPVAVTANDTLAALQQGIIDGAESDLVSYIDNLCYETAPYYSSTGHVMAPDLLMISNTTLAAMSQEDQEALKKVCNASIAVCFTKTAEQDAAYRTKAAELGVTFTESDAAFRSACADVTSAAAAQSELTQRVYDAIAGMR